MNRAPTLPLAKLPRTALDLVDAIGLPATLKLIETRGGEVFQVPHGKRRRGAALIEELAEAIGLPAAKQLAAVYGGQYLSVPNCRRALIAMRDADLQARYDALIRAGHSARATENLLAREFGITVTTVRRASTRDAGAAARAVDTFASSVP